MAWDDDSLTKGRISPSQILDSVSGKHRSPAAMSEEESAAQSPAKKSDPLPCPGDPYRAHARFLNRLPSEPRMIHFVMADFSWEAFAYSDLRRLRWVSPADPGQGPLLRMRFVESEITDVEIAGRHLRDVAHWISEGVMPWLWEKPHGFQVRDDAATVIARISIHPAKGRMSGE